MKGLDKNNISEFTPGNLKGLALWIKAEETSCTFKSVQEYATKGVLPTIGQNILQQYSDNPNQKVIVDIKSSVGSQPNSLVRLEIDTIGRTRFPTFVSEPEKLDVISIQDMIDTANPSQRKEKLCTKSEINLSDMTIYTISTNINVTYNNNLKLLFISVVDPTAPVTEFSEIIVFSRKLSEEENTLMEGYLAFKKNEQYLLKLDHAYLPDIQSLPFLKTISSELTDLEISIQTHMEDFDKAVETYRNHLPNAEILNGAPPIKDKAKSALNQLLTIRKNLVKGGLLARKQKTESIGATFDAIQKLSLYSEPFTVDILNSKIAEFKGINTILDVYMQSLNNVDKDTEDAVNQNKINEQLKKRTDAISVEGLKDKSASEEAKKEYIRLREKVDRLNGLGRNAYDSMFSDFTQKMKMVSDNINYYYSSVISKWNTLLSNYKTLEKIIASGEWLTYDASLKTENTVTKRGDATYHVEYTDEYYKSVQNLYELIRNQIIEGDLVYLRNEIDYIRAMNRIFLKKLSDKEINPTSKKMFVFLFKNRLKDMIKYEKEFIKLYIVIGDAISEMLSVLGLNKKYSTSKTKIMKSYPISAVFKYKSESSEISYIRKVNKHDHSLSMIEFVITDKNGQIMDIETNLFFPSLENVFRNKDEDYFTKKLPFIDDTGKILVKKYSVLPPYSKKENILDSMVKQQVLPKYFHVIDGLFEVPRDSENGIYEMRLESPQMPVMLPKYAMTDGAYFICVNVGEIPITIRIPGFEEDTYDLIGPDEVCMYIYTGVGSSTVSFYGRVQWIQNGIAYDTIYDVPRSSLCCKLEDLSIHVYMRNEKLPLFDRNGFLIEVHPTKAETNTESDSSPYYVYNIDDFYRACPYEVKIMANTMKIPDLEINSDWGEQGIPADMEQKIHVVEEASTNFTVICNSRGFPAVDEFGYAKYVKSPLLQIKDTIVTRSSKGDNIEVSLNTSVQVVQYGLAPTEDLFPKVYRSNFVKPFVPPDTPSTSPVNAFVFINHLGYPLVSPSNEYIQVENFVFEPPLYVKYTENFVTEYAYIPEDSKFFESSKTILQVKPFPRIILNSAEEKEVAETSSMVNIISYRYKTGGLYIQYTITQLKTDIATCESLKGTFDGISDTLELLNDYIRDITRLQIDYKSYNDTITAIKTRGMISDKSNDEKIAMNTFDLKMKDTLNRVYNLYTNGKKPVIFFKYIHEKIENIRGEKKDLVENVAPAIKTNISEIQTIQQNHSVLKGESKKSDLLKLINTCVEKDLEFNGILKTLETNLSNIPSNLNSLESWVNTQETLIERAREIHKEIVEINDVNTVDVFSQQIANNIANTTKKLKENRDKIEGLIEYKKRIALWLKIHPDPGLQKDYSEKYPVITTAPTLKGYTIKFLPFEELENPNIHRDWYSLDKTALLDSATRMRVSVKLIEPMNSHIEKYKEFYTSYDINANAPDPLTYQTADEKALQKIVDESDKTTNEHIAKAVDSENSLKPIFEEYENIRSDLRVEIQKILEKKARDIQEKWLENTGKRDAIKTNILLLQSYFNEDQITKINQVNADLDQIFSTDKLSAIDSIQQSLKVPDYYTNMNYLKMIEVSTKWDDVLGEINIIADKIASVQSTMETIQKDALSNMQESIKTGKNDIVAAYTTLKEEISDGAILKTLTSKMDPRISEIMEEKSEDIPSSITLLKSISDLKNELKTSSP